MGEGCYMDTQYNITCNTSYNPPKPFLGDGRLEVLNISLDAEILIEGRQQYASYCRNSIGSNDTSFSLNVSPFRFSANRSRFTAIGCNTMATISELQELAFASGCLSFCTNQTIVEDGSCDGMGCCQNNIPKGLQVFNVSLSSALSFTGTWENSTCSFAFMAAEDLFSFKASDVFESSLNRNSIPVALDWAIGNLTCTDEAAHYSCGPSSHCSNSTNGPGYRCYCDEGFEGNPYLSIGCQDINECKEGYNNSCAMEATCHNTIGSYECKCPANHHGDGHETGSGCMENTGAVPVVAIIGGTGLGIILLFACIFLVYWAIKRQRLIRLREKFFEQNGGLLLRQHIATHKGVADIAKIFTIDDIKKATNNFDERQILGQGGYGTVYKGILSDNRVVAIKKSKIVDQGQIIQFINEVDILSQINHRNVVKLLGCCLETEVPLLVYEFISSGTLYEHIHEENYATSISWEDRLRVAAETAGALAYLHSAHSIPVLHRDVKSTNILLDDNYTAKVSDFGASRLAPMDRIQMTTLVQGTYGYLDPEGFYTGQLTDKSDVYSFGVVLAELLTGENPISSERAEEHRSLAMYFISSMANKKLFQILDDQVAKEGNKEQLLGVANLVMKCLKIKGEERPTMKEVAAELDALRMSYVQQWKQLNHTETDYLLGGLGDQPSNLCVGESGVQESVGSNFMLALKIAR
ncbi:putative wall-associated receptor kinase-like 16 [Telopea speciosissima]|uniref:putative wall-associated receptor kinase-like 16 n=1 Tax=Telopea speciosissima TaxID=54955 RepID=UPI001CC74273|nr:putative wall-associated receptor kinase-like 16 [Telopea speciosissima]